MTENVTFTHFSTILEQKTYIWHDFFKSLVDRFHVEAIPNHAVSHTDPSRGIYHPLNNDFDVIKDANTECAEQSFKWLNKYKLTTINTDSI